ncbi:MAG TPA: alpha/beta fold hydrolase [Thiobacillus sp.]|nr:alpha/beta fold hydrolase [Thiobacillus sp.]
MWPIVINPLSVRYPKTSLIPNTKACIVGFIFIFSVSTAARWAQANEVSLPYKGLSLNANLELAPGKQPADGVILITHGGLAHRDMELITDLQKQFKERAYNTLAINLSLGLSNRHGIYDCNVTHRHLNDDAKEEIGAWINWLHKQGARRVVLLGHSRGGAQTALYAAERDNELVKAVVLLAPATKDNTNAAIYPRRYQKPLEPLLEKARKLVDSGKGDAVLKHVGLLSCSDTMATARTFVSYYGQDPRLDSPYLIPKLKKPTLVVVAGSDEEVIGLGKKLAPLADGTRVRMKVIEGADHLFRDLYADDAADAIDTFLKSIAYAAPAT